MKPMFISTNQNFEECCLVIKERITALNGWLIQLKNHPKAIPNPKFPCCPKANVLLAYRHLEDAKMRLDMAVLCNIPEEVTK